ncbi:MAG: hypothetical protein AAFY88_10195 [Acidobacteriota bacterium]
MTKSSLPLPRGLRTAAAVALAALTAVAFTTVAASTAGASELNRAIFNLDNDTISVILNDVRYPVDDFDFPAGTTHINNLYIGLFDGVTGYYFNDFVQGGNSSLILIDDVVLGGVAPTQTATLTFADADPPTRFTIELFVEMLGDGSHGLRLTATITNLAGQPLDNAKFFVFSDVLVGATEGGDVTAFDADSGIFYAFDNTNSPNTWFGVHSNGRYPLYYEGRAYQGPVGLAPFHAALVTGANLSNTVETTPQDQVAAWNWDLGSITATATVGFAIAAHTDLASMVESLEASVPDRMDLVFTDDFESGDTSSWGTVVGDP